MSAFRPVLPFSAALFLLLIVVAVLPSIGLEIGNLISFQSGSLAANAAKPVATEVSGFPVVTSDSCVAALDIANYANTLVAQMNEVFGTHLDATVVNGNACQAAMYLLPVSDQYDQLIISAREFDSNNATSVRSFYVNVFILAGDVAILNDKAAYSVAFKSTAVLNDGLKLAKIRTLCGDSCYARFSDKFTGSFGTTRISS